MDQILLVTACLAAVTDVRFGKIPNRLLISAGLLATAACGYTRGAAGLAVSCISAAVVAAVFAPVFYFRMIGAGDIKLMMLAGFVIGMRNLPRFLLAVFLMGGVMSAGYLVCRQLSLSERLACFAGYLREYVVTGKRRRYLRVSGEENIPFAVPVFAAVLFFCGEGMLRV